MHKLNMFIKHYRLAENVFTDVDSHRKLRNITGDIMYIFLSPNYHYIAPGVQKMSEHANEVRGKFWLFGENFNQQSKN